VSTNVADMTTDTDTLKLLPTWTAICTFMDYSLLCSRSRPARPPHDGGRALAVTQSPAGFPWGCLTALRRGCATPGITPRRDELSPWRGVPNSLMMNKCSI
jgi:hypothetical protein